MYKKDFIRLYLCWISVDDNHLSFGKWNFFFVLLWGDFLSLSQTKKASTLIRCHCSGRVVLKSFYQIVHKNLMLPQSIYKVNIFKYCRNLHCLSPMWKPTKLGHVCCKYLIVIICHGVTSLDLTLTVDLHTLIQITQTLLNLEFCNLNLNPDQY